MARHKKTMRRRNTRLRVSKQRVSKKRVSRRKVKKGKRTRRVMRGGSGRDKWTCPGCGVKTNQDPCKIVTHRETYLHDTGRFDREGKRIMVEKERDVFCNTPKPAPAGQGAFAELDPFR